MDHIIQVPMKPIESGSASLGIREIEMKTEVKLAFYSPV